MSTKTKFAAAALVALTLGATAIASTSEAQAHGWGWGGFGVGIAAGALLGAAAASTPTYVVTTGFRRCHLAPRYNVYGYYIGSTRVCSYYSDCVLRLPPARLTRSDARATVRSPNWRYCLT